MFSYFLLFIVLFNTVHVKGQSQLEIDVLNARNIYRAKHGVPTVFLDSSLSVFAQDWADQIAKNDKMSHRPDNKYGENIYGTSGKANGTEAVISFYNEINDYDFNNPGFSDETGHFTQVVWKNSQKIGVVMAKGREWSYVVVNYDPPGNYPGQFDENVPRPIS